MLIPHHASRIGLVLGGGGARGLAHIGVLKVLEDHQVPIAFVAGTSMGGLIGAAYASGFRARDLEHEVVRLSRRAQFLRLADFTPTFSGLLSGHRLVDYFAEHLGIDRTFGELKVPLALTATDLVSGREVILDSGSVILAMRATMSIPGIYHPVPMGAKRLVDGGILDNVPTAAARRMGAERLIAVDVLPCFADNRPDAPLAVAPMMPPYFPPVARDLWHTVFLTLSALTDYRLQETPPDVLLRPDLPADVTLLLGFNRAEALIAAGEAAALSQLDDLLLLAHPPTARASSNRTAF